MRFPRVRVSRAVLRRWLTPGIGIKRGCWSSSSASCAWRWPGLCCCVRSTASTTYRVRARRPVCGHAPVPAVLAARRDRRRGGRRSVRLRLVAGDPRADGTVPQLGGRPAAGRGDLPEAIPGARAEDRRDRRRNRPVHSAARDSRSTRATSPPWSRSPTTADLRAAARGARAFRRWATSGTAS